MKSQFKKTTIKMIMLLVMAISFFVFAGRANAANIGLEQKILPVRLVYLNQSGEIEKIWDNVSKKDNLYAIKFYDHKNQLLPSATDTNMWQRYCGYYSKEARNFKEDNKKNLTINFIKKENKTEEIHTYV